MGLTVLIAEDEIAERNAIHRIVADALEVYDVSISLASNGDLAAEVITTSAPQLLFLDVHMSGPNGIELARRARAVRDNARIAFVSAYGRFEYAQEALRLGATDFLVKPFDDSELSKLAVGMAQDVLGVNQSKVGFSEQAIAYLHGFIERELIQRIVHSHVLDSNSAETLRVLLDSIGNEWVCILQRRGEIKTDPARLLEFLGFKGRSIAAEDGEDLIIVAETTASSKDGLPQRAVIDNGLVGVSSMYLMPESLPVAYREAREVVYEEAPVVEESRSWTFSQTGRIAGRLMELSASGDPEATRVELRRLITPRLSAVDSVAAVRDLVSDLVDLVMVFSDRIYQAFDDESLIPSREAVFSEARAQVPRADAVLSEVEAFCLEATRRVRANLTNSTEGSVLFVREYIKNHFRSHISLEDVAELVSLSPSYLSRSFHRITGRTFQEYLAELRINQAKRLLALPSPSVKEIAYKVGFSSSNHFCRAFRQRVGTTPQTFARQHKQVPEEEGL
jgi:two-component system response regulator YesN